MQIGTFLTALHRFPVSEAQRAGVLGGNVEDWRREYLGLYGEVRHVAPLLTLTEQARVAAFWGHYLDDAANLDFTPTLIHRDLTEEHILMSTETGRLSGIIDWGDASIGDPAMDFAGLSRCLGDAFTQRVFDAYEPAHRDIGPETFWRRVRSTQRSSRSMRSSSAGSKATQGTSSMGWRCCAER